MIIKWIIKVALLMALLSGCASQPQSQPSPAAATKPVVLKKQPPARQPILRHNGTIQNAEKIPSTTTVTKIPAASKSSLPEPTKPHGIAKAPTGMKPDGNPPAELKNQPLTGPVVKPAASAAPKVTSHLELKHEAAVAKPLEATKQPSKGALQTGTLEKIPAQFALPEDKKAATMYLKGKERPEPGSDVPTGAKTQLASIPEGSDDATFYTEFGSWTYDEQHLPKNLPGGWVLDIRPDQLGSDRRCLLYSAREPIFDGYDNSWIRLQITTDAVVVNADSNLDSTYPGQGLRVDNGELIPFTTGLLNKKTTYTKQANPASMVNGRTCTLFLGFWPTWPVTKTQHVSIDLAGFKRAYAALKACSDAQ